MSFKFYGEKFEAPQLPKSLFFGQLLGAKVGCRLKKNLNKKLGAELPPSAEFSISDKKR
jgi:hypothetical protein